MAGSLEHGNDGSIALYINNDLQFDSTDEHIYHEGLVLPALALATDRIPTPLNILIIGGGDGLVARELFKSKHINKIDLVDYDPEILNYAQADFAKLNHSSLSDPRLTIHIKDAWILVEESLQAKSYYDLIISDLTVPDDANSARFHSIEWYAKLSSLLSPNGLLAVNGVSALATPEAFWSIFNSMSKGNLYVRPSHVEIPSFAAKGYGPDWSFFIASNQPLLSSEFTNISLIEPRSFIKDNSHLLELFNFPKELFAYQSISAPALAGSDILIHYFNNASTLTISGIKQNSLSFDINIDSIPQADTGKNILPPNLNSALSQINLAGPIDSELVLEDILKLMPALQRQCPPELVEEFVENPACFLEGIDLQNLVAKLLQRAKELPEQLVAELELLRDKLQDWAGDHLSLFALGQRIITVLTVVIVIGNLLYPDSVYGKGEHAAAGHHHAAAGARAGGGRRGGRWVNGTWVNGPYTNTRIIRQTVPARTIVRPNTSGFLPNNPTIDQSSYISIVERNIEASKNRLIQSKKEIIVQKEILEKELQQYQSAPEIIVTFGIHKIERAEAIRRTQSAIQKTDNQITAIDKQILQAPSALELAKIAFAGLQSLQETNTHKDSENEFS